MGEVIGALMIFALFFGLFFLASKESLKGALIVFGIFAVLMTWIVVASLLLTGMKFL